MIHRPCGTASTAQRVLCDHYLFAYIASFQRGFSGDVVDLVRAHDTTFRPRGWLPALVVGRGDLRLLQRLYRHVKDQAAVYSGRSFLSFGCVWLDALEVGKLDMAEWIDSNAQLQSDHNATVTLRFALASRRIEVVKWLLQRWPQWRAKVTPDAIEDCPTVELFQWLEANVSPLPSLTQLLDRASELGRLELLRYIVTKYPGERCSQRAIVGAASHGHVESVRFLHEHAHGQCSSNAMRGAAWNGHFAVVQYLNANCPMAHGDAFELAALGGHLEIVQYLVRSRTDVHVVRAHALVKQSGQHRDVQAYLSAILNPVKHTSKKNQEYRTPLCGLL